MYDVQKMASGSFKAGGNLYARKCEGGFEMWRRMNGQWVTLHVVETKQEALSWLKAWDKEEERKCRG